MVSARDIKDEMGYKEWRNFNNLIERAVQLINSGTERGVILKTEKMAKIGRGAIRIVVDYELDSDAIDILQRISSYKLNKSIRLRNEAVVLTMLEKYCKLKAIPFDFQYELDGYKYDCLINGNVLMEFDEQQHTTKRQIVVDKEKNTTAKLGGYKMIRFDISNDIIDIICAVDEHITNKKIEEATNE